MRDAKALILERATVPPQTWGYDDVTAGILRHLDPRASKDGRYQVLEAGGGSASHLPLPDGAEVTTIDISAEALALNSYATEKLCGDIQEFDYGQRRYDLIICWDVLEHLERPEAALARFADILKPDGRIVLVGPVPTTVKGLVTRLSPHWVHVQFYRRVLGSTTAGLPGHPPFATHLAAAADPRRAAAFLTARGFKIDALKGYKSNHIAALGDKSRLVLGAYRFVEWALSIASRGRTDRGITDFFLVAARSR